jgi:CPA2 family monovalent cation:H+ antiporter-2
LHLDPILPRIVAAVFALLLIGLLLRRLRQPHVVAYLLAGVALGPSGLRLFSDELVLALSRSLVVEASLPRVGAEA